MMPYQHSLAVTLFCLAAIGCASNATNGRSDQDPLNSARPEEKDSSTTILAEREKLMGTWEYLNARYDGQEFAMGNSPDGGPARIVITKDRWTIYRHGLKVPSTWKIDISNTPKTLIQKVEHPTYGTFSMESIYRFDENGNLQTCEMDHPEKPKPTRFAAGKGDGQFLVLMKRVDGKN